MDDMPQRDGTALVAHSGSDLVETVDAAPRPRFTRLARRSRGSREKVVKPSALGMLLRPIGIAVGVVLCTYAVLSLGTTFYRSYQRHIDHSAAVHTDNSILDIFFGDQGLPPMRSILSSRTSTAIFIRSWRASRRPTNSSTTPS